MSRTRTVKRRRRAGKAPAARHHTPGRTDAAPRGEGGGQPASSGDLSTVLKAATAPLLAAAMVTTAGTSASAATPTTSEALSFGPGPSKTSPGRAMPATAAFAQRVQVTYVVRPGDTVSHISARSGVSVRAIIRANKLSAQGLIHPGQRLVLPGLRTPGTANASARTLLYTVRSGDTVTDIATRFAVTVRSVIQANQLGPSAVIHPGQRLRLPGATQRGAQQPAPATPTASDSKTTSYVVRAGDTLSSIAAAHDTTLATLLSWNKLSLSAVIHPGQKLLVPADTQQDTASAENTFLGRTYPEPVVQAAHRNRAALAKRKLPSRAQMRTIVATTAGQRGVDPALAMAIAWQESGFNPYVVSPANAIGTMQVIPSTGQWASDMIGQRLDLLDAQDNVTAGVTVLGRLLASAESTDQAIAGYYQGLASVRQHGMYSDTKRYVANVRAHQQRFAAESAT